MYKLLFILMLTVLLSCSCGSGIAPTLVVEGPVDKPVITDTADEPVAGTEKEEGDK